MYKLKRTDQGLISMMESDPHSPEEYRVNGVVGNVNGFYEAFNVTEDDFLFTAPEDRVFIYR